MSEMIRIFAQKLLRRLQKNPEKAAENGNANNNGESGTPSREAMEDGEMPQEPVIQTEYLPEQVAVPADKAQVLQHVELIFALCVRCPDMLDE
jgi:symplekin